MKILIKNCSLISVSDNRPKIEEGIDILINDSIIDRIDRNIDEGCDRVIDASGKVVMPGLINTHSHVPMSIFRETVDGYKTQEWLEKKIWPMEDNMNADDAYWASMLSFIEMIKTGSTTINDMYFFSDSIVKAALESGIRLQTTRTLVGKGDKDNGRLDELDNLISKYHEDTISFNAGIHGMYTSDRAYVRKCIDYAKSKNIPIHMHLCENIEEREEIIKSYEVKSPGDVIAEDFKGTHTILAHAVKISQEDIDAIKDMDICIAHCPISNLKLGCGVAPISKMIEAGICVSLGTDGQGSGSNLDMFETMKYAALLQKGIEENPVLMPAYDVIKMATINGAKALGLEKEIGSIEEGKKADIIIVNTDNIVMQPLNDIISDIVYNTKGSDVDTTIVNGQILMENKMFTNSIDEKSIISKCTEIINRL